MHQASLIEFIDLSREWSNVARGRELFRLAGKAFADLFQVDSGFFVYQRRLYGPQLEPLQVYEPWGAFAKEADKLDSWVNQWKSPSAFDQGIEIMLRRWCPSIQMPGTWRGIWSEYSLQQGSAWPIYSRGACVGMVVLGRSSTRMHHDEDALEICMKQVALILDMLLAWRRADVNERRYKQFIENAWDTIAVIDPDRWLYINRSGVRMFGAADETELVGNTVYPFLHANSLSSFRECCQRVLKTGRHVGPMEFQWLNVSGELVHSDVVMTQLRFGKDVAVQLFIRDLTEQKRTRELLSKSEKLSALGQLAAGVAHEIRNPLTALKGFTQLLKELMENRSHMYLDVMEGELNRIESIVGELLLLAKPQVTAFRACRIDAVVQQVVLLLTTMATPQGVEIKLKGFGGDGLWVECDENQMKQVFFNIVKNGIESMPNGGLLTVDADVEDDVISLRFTDEGCGIPPECLPRLGEPFYTTKDSGTGLGLMVSHGIVHGHGGFIDIRSVVGSGTVVEIRLPRIQPVVGMAQ